MRHATTAVTPGSVQIRAGGAPALARLRAPKQLVIIPGATHFFEEPGTLD